MGILAFVEVLIVQERPSKLFSLAVVESLAAFWSPLVRGFSLYSIGKSNLPHWLGRAVSSVHGYRSDCRCSLGAEASSSRAYLLTCCYEESIHT